MGDDEGPLAKAICSLSAIVPVGMGSSNISPSSVCWLCMCWFHATMLPNFSLQMLHSGAASDTGVPNLSVDFGTLLLIVEVDGDAPLLHFILP